MPREILPLFLGKVKVDPETECWVWTKSTREGYGQITVNKRAWGAHRYAYTVYNGEIPEGKVVRHLCHNTRCCNPDHLVLGTDQQNWNDSRQIHRNDYFKKATIWQINGERYAGMRAARAGTGLPFATLLKYSTNGVFDVEAYRKACFDKSLEPKI